MGVYYAKLHATNVQNRLKGKIRKLEEENEKLKDQLDAAYDAHAGECGKCRVRWAQLRELRGAKRD
jgi:hypothetical protein